LLQEDGRKGDFQIEGAIDRNRNGRVQRIEEYKRLVSFPPFLPVKKIPILALPLPSSVAQSATPDRIVAKRTLPDEEDESVFQFVQDDGEDVRNIFSLPPCKKISHPRL
jgi:hypothetical protein